MEKYFKRIEDFGKYKKSLGIPEPTYAMINKPWLTQENGVLVKPLIKEEKNERLDITYIGLIFPDMTDGHKYKSQTDTIHFINSGIIEFSHDEFSSKRPIPFEAGDTIQIPPPVIRRLVPNASNDDQLEIELIVQPKFDPKDEIHVYN